MRAQSILVIVTAYFLGMLLFACALLPRVHAAEFMSHETVMDGFTHPQKAPQMARPMIYLPTKKVLGKKHRKGKKHGSQKLGKRRKGNGTPSGATPTPENPNAGGTPASTGGGGPGSVGTPIINDRGVDLRPRDSNIKDQAGPICTAYAGNAGIENLIGRQSPDFSEDYTFSLYGVYSVDEFANRVPGRELALEGMWPRGGRKQVPFATTSHRLNTISYLGDGEIEGAKKALRASHPVFFGFEVPSDMASCLASIRPSTKVTRGGHAVLIVGYQDDSTNEKLGGGYFIIKNSWSEGCGDHGYQYLPYSYCEKSYCYFYEMAKAE